MEKEPLVSVQDDGFVLPVVHEELKVGTRVVETGRGVRIHKTVSEQTRQIDEHLLRDAIEVRRVAVDQIVPLSEAPATRQVGDTLIIPVLEEVLVVEKRLRIKEEIHIVRSERHEPYAATVVVRSEDVSIERFGDRSDPEVIPTDGGSNHAANTRSRI
jgi:uncharacterized protein (TIGR02271 family)